MGAYNERVGAYTNLGHPVGGLITAAMDNQNLLVALMAEGLMEMFPKLRTLWAHSGAAWLPFILERIETYLWLSYQQRPVSLNPDGVFHAHQNAIGFDSCDGSIRQMSTLFETTGAWGSRYPNQETGTAWDAIADLEQGGVPANTVQKLMGANAARVLQVKQRSFVAA